MLTAWACAALYIDLAPAPFRILAAAVYLLLVVALALRARTHFHRTLVCAAMFGLVLAAWLSLKPSNNRPWQDDVAKTAWAEINGDDITIHNFRYCHYRAEFDYSCDWLTRTYRLSELRGIDIAITYWGSPYIAHPIVSFWFGGNDYVAASIETRKQVGIGYSAILGFFRKYELIYLFSDERDLIRLRTNFRTGEEVYLYRTTAGPAWSRELFLQYVQQANQLRDHPEWYNALTRNCTTVIFHFMRSIGPLPNGTSRFDWRILLNGRADEMLYNGGNFDSTIPFAELKQAVHINDAARKSDDSPDFSRLIRIGRPGFEDIH